MAKIAIILGSIREGRAGEAVAHWVTAQADSRGHDYELVDLKDYPLPLMDAAVIPGQANKQYADPQVQAWGDKMDTFDGYVFVTPEYNHNVPGVFKNAFDSIAGEWAGKPVTFVGYGFGGGADAIAGWRKSIGGLLQMNATDSDVKIMIPEYFGEQGFAPDDALNATLASVLDELEQKF